MIDIGLTRIGAVSATAGAALLVAATLLHPMEAHPGDMLTAFQEYARAEHWIAIHLLQFLGAALITGGLIGLYGTLVEGAGGAWVRLGLVAAAANLAVAAALQAVDGIALKTMVDAWVAAPETEKPLAFLGAQAIRQIEVGLAGMLGLLSGITLALYGFAIAVDSLYPRWLGLVAIIAALATAAGGVAMTASGFSDIAIMISLPANSLLLLWVIVMGFLMWRQATPASRSTTSAAQDAP